MLGALSLTTDLASGLPFEKGLRTCALASALGVAAGLREDEQTALFQASLLRAVGCTSNASENAALFGDDTAFQAALKPMDPADPVIFAVQLARFGEWAGPTAAPALARRFVEVAPTEGRRATRAGCEVSRALGIRLGLASAAVDALDDVFERWDGQGIPEGRRGEELSPIARILHVAEQAVFAHTAGGRRAAVAEVRRRAGGHLDPDLAARFLADADGLLAVLEQPDLLAAVVAVEPGPGAVVLPHELVEWCRALSVIVDLKGRFLLGHSAHVADTADAAAALTGMGQPERLTLQAGALLHDLGRVGVSSAVWDRPGALGAADWERVRLHGYWTDRILRRCPSLAPIAPIAAGHHERCDGTGYHRGVRSADLPFPARLLAAADVFAALTEDRPHRRSHSLDEAAGVLTTEATAGRLDGDACAAVVEGAGLPRPRTARPCGLTDREVEVLRLSARGLSNRRIARELLISERTVAHHLAHVFDKTGRRTRAGAAVFAMEHDLVPAVPPTG